MNKKYHMKKEIIDRLQCANGGDGETYEYWFDPQTEKLYEVPLRVERKFNDSLQIEDKNAIAQFFKWYMKSSEPYNTR